MMNKIRKYIKSLQDRSGGQGVLWEGFRHFGNRFHTYTDWRILLWTFTVISVVGIGWNAYLFYQINSGSITTKDIENQIGLETLDRSELNSTLKQLKRQETTFKSIQNSSTTMSDPAQDSFVTIEEGDLE